MTITKADVADLRPGDVVEIIGWEYTDVAIRGPLRNLGGALGVGGYLIRHTGGDPAKPLRSNATLTIVSRAPAPLYVNHDRAEPVPGDVVRDADSDDPMVWMLDGGNPIATPWSPPYGDQCCYRDDLPARLRLLVDGETGQVVP